MTELPPPVWDQQQMQRVVEQARIDYRTVPCPVHGLALGVIETLATRAGSVGYQVRAFPGPPPDSSWTAVRGTLQCEQCGVSASMDFSEWNAA